MLDPPLESWYGWLGVGLVSVIVAGIALALPTAAPPSATPVADAVDSVAASPHEARTTVDVPAEEIRVRPDEIALRSDGGTAHASFAYAPVTPVGEGRLRRVLDGERPSAVFSSEAAFQGAIRSARSHEDIWREAPARLTVARVEWGDVHATLVG
jgi:hypothetical protein